MILDTIANMERYAGVHPRFATVFDYISKTDLLALANGRHAILGQDLFGIVERVPGRSKSDAQLECHRKYIDIQLVLSGVDTMGWKPRADCLLAVDDYNASADIQFFYDAPDAWIATPANAYCIFFPEDAHAPLVGSQNIHKIVFKIAVDADY
ncbi:MAG: hypothetical protein RLZZ379_949 [Pseudomonadota bacterium]|jgi:YhcH/YjgK/YiaL family protein